MSSVHQISTHDLIALIMMNTWCISDTQKVEESGSKASKSLFGQSTQRAPNTQANMDELLGLCSGVFTEMWVDL